MAALIEIVPLEGSYDASALNTCNTNNAASFMIGRHWRTWELYINGRSYPWPKEKDPVETYELREHIKECIELDKAFYDNT